MRLIASFYTAAIDHGLPIAELKMTPLIDVLLGGAVCAVSGGAGGGQAGGGGAVGV